MNAESKRVGRVRRGARGGLPVLTATAVLAAVVVGAGVVGYVVLDAIGASHASSATVHQCYPPNRPQCTGSDNASAGASSSAVGLPGAVG